MRLVCLCSSRGHTRNDLRGTFEDRGRCQFQRRALRAFVCPTLAQRARKDGAASAVLGTGSQHQNQTQRQEQRTGVSVPHGQRQEQRQRQRRALRAFVCPTPSARSGQALAAKVRARMGQPRKNPGRGQDQNQDQPQRQKQRTGVSVPHGQRSRATSTSRARAAGVCVSHPCAKCAQGWGTLGVFWGKEVKININIKSNGQECPFHTATQWRRVGRFDIIRAGIE